jgi:hypothetical protein
MKKRAASLSDNDCPWGMPREEYNRLSSKEKKAVRNKIGAGKFRAKKKSTSCSSLPRISL